MLAPHARVPVAGELDPQLTPHNGDFPTNPPARFTNSDISDTMKICIVALAIIYSSSIQGITSYTDNRFNGNCRCYHTT